MPCFDSGCNIDVWGFFCFVLKDVSPPASRIATDCTRTFPMVSSQNTGCTVRHCLSVPFTYLHTSLCDSHFPLSFTALACAEPYRHRVYFSTSSSLHLYLLWRQQRSAGLVPVASNSDSTWLFCFTSVIQVSRTKSRWGCD